ncbi:hypothetical protein PN441_11360 [Spirulina major CS-329]|nr:MULTISPECIES: hypothetical protein [Spirulina]MDB9495243.1 hypothetical protein [Spirulina subsalsa CS-330]MDB9503669.1 hypothetical protein [Spirulina major CS-329]
MRSDLIGGITHQSRDNQFLRRFQFTTGDRKTRRHPTRYHGIAQFQ